MQRAEVTEANSSPGVAESPRSTAPWRVLTARVEPGFRLHVTFLDGTTGQVELEDFLTNSKVTGTVFEPLREPSFFSQARVEHGAVTWPSGADLAPDAMYDAIAERGVWVVG